MQADAVDTVFYEAHFEQDGGFRIDPETGAASDWEGWRVRYRPLGSRRWTKFVTDADLNGLSVDEIQALCRTHAALGRS